jgi:hypothetical protein
LSNLELPKTKLPLENNRDYRPQFFFRTTDVTGEACLLGADMCMPGDNVAMQIGLDKPVAIEKGTRFAIREGSRTVGRGVVIGSRPALRALPIRQFVVTTVDSAFMQPRHEMCSSIAS